MPVAVVRPTMKTTHAMKILAAVAVALGCGPAEVEEALGTDETIPERLAGGGAAGGVPQGDQEQGNQEQGNQEQGNQEQGTSYTGGAVKWIRFTGMKHGGVTLASAQFVNGRLQATKTVSGVSDVLSGPELVGTELVGVLAGGGTVTLKIDDVDPDTDRMNMFQSRIDPVTGQYGQNGSEVYLYRLKRKVNDLWIDVCTPHYKPGIVKGPEYADSRRAAFVRGYWQEYEDENLGTYTEYFESPSQFTFSCWDGVMGKCTRWGYMPWKTLPDPRGASYPAVNMKNVWRACVRAARADYCGDGVSRTVNGTSVDMYDVFGFVQKVGEGKPHPLMFAEESSFDVGGAGCLERSRYESLPASCLEGIWIPPDYETPGHYRPVYHPIQNYAEGERNSCLYTSTGAVRSGQLIVVDSSTYCKHDTSTQGRGLASDCNDCTGFVCADSAYEYCCDHQDPGAWDAACVARAAACSLVLPSGFPYN